MNSRPSVDSTIQNSNIKIFANLQRLLINIFDIQKGDIVIAKSSSDPKSNICKRIIALEGDKTLSNNPSGFFQSYSWGFPGGPMVTNPPFNAGNTGLIPDQGTKIPPAVGQLSLCSTAILSLLSTACDLWQQAAAMQSLHTTTSEQSSLTATGEISLTALKNPCAATKTQHSHINK